MTALKEQQHVHFNCCCSLELYVMLIKFERKKNLFFPNSTIFFSYLLQNKRISMFVTNEPELRKTIEIIPEDF